jgi:hypothetical protein
MAAVYTENHKRPGLYSVRVGRFNISNVNNIQKVTRAEALAIKAAAVPEGQSTEIWHDVRAAGCPIMDLAIDLNRLKSRLLPIRHRRFGGQPSPDDYEVLEAFRKGDGTTIKAVLYNRRSETYYFTTGTSVEPADKHTDAMEPGWHIFNSYLIAPPAFWRKVRERI